jgi:hypothetical protein
MRFLERFGRFWWDFVVGDDWVVAVGAVAGLAGTWALAHYDVTAWWLMPIVAAGLLALSLRRAIR